MVPVCMVRSSRYGPRLYGPELQVWSPIVWFGTPRVVPVCMVRNSRYGPRLYGSELQVWSPLVWFGTPGMVPACMVRNSRYGPRLYGSELQVWSPLVWFGTPGMVPACMVRNSRYGPRLSVAVAFKIYDIDKDGYISNGELFQVLKMMVGNNLKDTQLQQIVDKTIVLADLDGDGKISFEEFCAVSLIFCVFISFFSNFLY